MTKVAIFRFKVSNWTSSAMEKDMSTLAFKNAQRKLVSEEKIENTLNYFMEDKEIISVDVKTIDVHYHNNGRANEIDLIYTILYKNSEV